MVVMVLVASAATLLATHYGFRARMVTQESRRIHLVALTDAAVAESVANLSDSPGFTGIPQRGFGGGTIESQIERPSEKQRTILATATYRGWTRRIRVQVRLNLGSIAVESWSTLPQG